MKYYLETNALRGLGSAIDKNQELLSKSYTSLFSIFEIFKGINLSDNEDTCKDSRKRKNILRKLGKINLKIIDFMPDEMIEGGFLGEVECHDSDVIKHSIIRIISGKKSDDTKSKNINDKYDKMKILFNEAIANKYNIKAPKQEFIKIKDLNDFIMPTPPSAPDFLNTVPKGSHPSKYAIEWIKQSDVPYLYKKWFKDTEKRDEDIISLYNGRLDLFLFACFSYELQKKCLRLEAEKNDMLDILHCLYLYNTDQCIVTNDKIFTSEKKSILPNINVISLEEYKKLM